MILVLVTVGGGVGTFAALSQICIFRIRPWLVERKLGSILTIAVVSLPFFLVFTVNRILQIVGAVQAWVTIGIFVCVGIAWFGTTIYLVSTDTYTEKYSRENPSAPVSRLRFAIAIVTGVLIFVAILYLMRTHG
jgi:hypothetical protein